MAYISAFMEEHDFMEITRGIDGEPTAFTARRTFGEEVGFHVAFCAEYDALPDIGHACGHNLIAGAAVAAALALCETYTGTPFKVTLVGTPDEEVRGGKVDLIRAGVFSDVDVALDVPSRFRNKNQCHLPGVQELDFNFIGKNAHAAAEPIEGRNALDGVILTFTNINTLRQYLKDDVRIHGIIKTEARQATLFPTGQRRIYVSVP